MTDPNITTVADGGNISLAFNYENIDRDLGVRLRDQAERIRRRMADHTTSIIETGRDLVAIKQQLPHGQFTKWVEGELRIAERTAQVYMAAFQFATESGKPATVALLPPTALHKLAAKSVPPTVRADVLAQIEAGEIITDEQITDAVKGALADMRHERREEAHRAKAARPRKRRLRHRFDREEHRRKWQEEERKWIERANAATAMLLRRLTPEELEVVVLALPRLDLVERQIAEYSIGVLKAKQVEGDR